MRHFIAALAVLALAGCATPSAYAPAERPGAAGFTETRIESDRYRVSFRGSSADSPERVADLALLRAAELTIGAGYNWFVVDHRYQEAAPGRGGPRVSVGVGGGSYGGSSGVGVGVGVGLPLGGREGPSAAVLEIRLGRGEKPADVNAYDAREVQSAVRARM